MRHFLALVVSLFIVGTAASPASAREDDREPLDGGVAWINTGGPIKLKELKGKVVLLDFWTLCCINCHHILPDLAKLEEKYKNELVVIGVHSPKFRAEQETASVRAKVAEYGIKHPVVNDADQTIWNYFRVQSWPTLILIDPEGRQVELTGADGQPVDQITGEGHYALLDRLIGTLVKRARASKTLNESPVKFFPENEKPDDTPLRFPGKVLADGRGGRLFVADTGHNRVVMTSLEGKSPVVIGNGQSGLADGAYDKAEFNRPQGMTLVGDVLYVADTENHAIRAVDLKKKTVSTVAGKGKQGGMLRKSATAKATELNSPWDVTHLASSPRNLYVAMAGSHQIWRLDVESGRVSVFAGTGVEEILDGPAERAHFAQPSGLATDGVHLFVADSEVSAVREIIFGPENVVRTVVGAGLFEFADIDGKGPVVRLQHCLGLAYGSGKLYIADTYNNKVKVCDPETRDVKTFAGDGKPGLTDAPAEFSQPGGLSVVGKTLYVADTNNHAIRVVDTATKAVSTLTLNGLNAPKPKPRKPSFPNAKAIELAKAVVAPGKQLTIDVTLPIPAGFKLNAEGSIPYDVEAPETPGLIDPAFTATGGRLATPAKEFTMTVPLARPTTAGEGFTLKVSAQAFVCSEGSNFCTIKSYVWTVPVKVSAEGAGKLTIAGK